MQMADFSHVLRSKLLVVKPSSDYVILREYSTVHVINNGMELVVPVDRVGYGYTLLQ